MVLFDNYNDVILTLSRTGYKIDKDENIPNTDKNKGPCFGYCLAFVAGLFLAFLVQDRCFVREFMD